MSNGAHDARAEGRDQDTRLLRAGDDRRRVWCPRRQPEDYDIALHRRQIEVDAGTQPGAVVVLRGRGMPVLQGYGRGDQRVLVNVVVPRHLSDEQKLLLEDFDAHAAERTYKPDDGFFDKLKSAFR